MSLTQRRKQPQLSAAHLGRVTRGSDACRDSPGDKPSAWSTPFLSAACALGQFLALRRSWLLVLGATTKHHPCGEVLGSRQPGSSLGFFPLSPSPQQAEDGHRSQVCGSGGLGGLPCPLFVAVLGPAVQLMFAGHCTSPWECPCQVEPAASLPAPGG